MLHRIADCRCSTDGIYVQRCTLLFIEVHGLTDKLRGIHALLGANGNVWLLHRTKDVGYGPDYIDTLIDYLSTYRRSLVRPENDGAPS